MAWAFCLAAAQGHRPAVGSREDICEAIWVNWELLGSYSIFGFGPTIPVAQRPVCLNPDLMFILISVLYTNIIKRGLHHPRLKLF